MECKYIRRHEIYNNIVQGQEGGVKIIVLYKFLHCKGGGIILIPGRLYKDAYFNYERNHKT